MEKEGCALQWVEVGGVGRGINSDISAICRHDRTSRDLTKGYMINVSFSQGTYSKRDDEVVCGC